MSAADISAGISLERLASDEPMAAGVAGSSAARLGADTLIVRVGFVVLGLACGFGLLAYGVIWLLTVGHDQPVRGRPTVRHDAGVIALTAFGVLFVAQVVPLPTALLLLVAMVGFALAFGWQGRVVAGVVLTGAGLVSAFDAGLLTGLSGLGATVLIAAAVTMVGIALLALPFAAKIMADAAEDRRARIRAEERADVAAHLHDSVMQTLTLIQNRANDPQATAALAHRQERELRQWLYGSPMNTDVSSFRVGLEAAAAEVEEQYLRVIECIVVGDCALSDPVDDAISACREAMINAAKFADVPVISVYAEVAEDSVRCFIRDRGIGFDVEAVPADRHGIADSIVARVGRVGGSATIAASLGSGTEVRIEVPR